MRYALNRRGSRPNDADAFVMEFVQSPSGITTSVVVVPATRMERMPFEIFDPRNPGQLGLVEWPTRHEHKARLKLITAIGDDCPASCFLIPAGLFDFRLEAGAFIQIEVLAD